MSMRIFLFHLHICAGDLNACRCVCIFSMPRTYLSVRPSVCLSVCLPVCLSVFVSVL